LKNSSKVSGVFVFSDVCSDACDAYAGGDSDMSDTELDFNDENPKMLLDLNADLDENDENDEKSEKLLKKPTVDLPFD
jgi:hypothetical protein